jgi:AcrR family transcriptional regulator
MTEGNGGRRERRKAQTRAEVRQIAQRLFAERGFDSVTIADVAATADVAVQTVFNHFETKEALFFDGRTPWVEGMAAAVVQRPPDTDPVTALRLALEDVLLGVLELEARPENRGYLLALHRSQLLQARERTLVQEAGVRVAIVLSQAIAAGDWSAVPAADHATARVLGRLIADVFLAAARVLVLEHRRLLLDAAPDEPRAVSVPVTAATTLEELEGSVRRLAGKLLDQSS